MWSGMEEEAVLLRVRDCQPRLTMAAAAVGGVLIAGQGQWLGVVLRPQHDALSEAVLHVAAPSGEAPATPVPSGTHFFGEDLATPRWANWKRSRGAGAPAGPLVPLELGMGSPVELRSAASGVVACLLPASRHLRMVDSGNPECCFLSFWMSVGYTPILHISPV